MISSREREIKVKVIDDTKDKYRIRLETTDGLEILTVKVTKDYNDPDHPNWFVTKAEIERGMPTETVPGYIGSLGGSDFLKTEATVDGDDITLRVYNEEFDILEIKCNYVNNTAKITKIAEIDVEDPESIIDEGEVPRKFIVRKFARVSGVDQETGDPIYEPPYYVIYKVLSHHEENWDGSDDSLLYVNDHIVPAYILTQENLETFVSVDNPEFVVFETLLRGEYLQSVTDPEVNPADILCAKKFMDMLPIGDDAHEYLIYNEDGEVVFPSYEALTYAWYSKTLTEDDTEIEETIGSTALFENIDGEIAPIEDNYILVNEHGNIYNYQILVEDKIDKDEAIIYIDCVNDIDARVEDYISISINGKVQALADLIYPNQEVYPLKIHNGDLVLIETQSGLLDDSVCKIPDSFDTTESYHTWGIVDFITGEKENYYIKLKHEGEEE